MKKQPYESPELELQWLLSEAVCADILSLTESDYEGDFGDDEGGENELP